MSGEENRAAWSSFISLGSLVAENGNNSDKIFLEGMKALGLLSFSGLIVLLGDVNGGDVDDIGLSMNDFIINQLLTQDEIQWVKGQMNLVLKTFFELSSGDFYKKLSENFKNCYNLFRNDLVQILNKYINICDEKIEELNEKKNEEQKGKNNNQQKQEAKKDENELDENEDSKQKDLNDEASNNTVSIAEEINNELNVNNEKNKNKNTLPSQEINNDESIKNEMNIKKNDNNENNNNDKNNNNPMKKTK